MQTISNKIPYISINRDTGHACLGESPAGSAIERNPVGHYVIFPKTMKEAKRIMREIRLRPANIEKYAKPL
jgi:hypothetical protein